jgi:hypothetical protein
MVMNNKIVFLFFIITLIISSCGKEQRKVIPKEITKPQENTSTWLPGLYKADFTTLNPHLNGTLPGSATVLLKDDKIFFYLRLFAGKPRAWHQQAIRLGSRCPEKKDDTNGDGFIDIYEADLVWGSIVTPLDSDPGTQNSGRNFYPLGDLSGSYWYERIVNAQRFMADLQSTDSNPEDNIVKFPSDQIFDFENKIVSILGIDEKTPLPETVATQGNKRAFQNLPIACGVIRKVYTAPGSPDTGIPGPIGEVIPGQDREGTPVFPSGTDRGSRGSGTNENEESETADENGRSEDRRSNPSEESDENSNDSQSNDETEPETDVTSE